MTSIEGPPIDPPFSGDVSDASLRLRALAALSGSLTDALSPAGAASLVEQKALSALGATTAVVLTIGDFPTLVDTDAAAAAADPDAAPTLKVVHAIGLSAEVQRSLEQLATHAAVPYAEVAHVGEPVYLRSPADLARYPEWGAAMADAGARAAAVVPVWANGELRGVLGLTWPDPRTFDADERAFVVTLGVMCAQAIMRAHLRAAEQAARVLAEEANRSKTHFLAMISHELRTPMNAVLGYTQLIAEEAVGPITPEQRVHLGRMRASGKHLLGLIEELLAYARIESGGDAVEHEQVALSDLVERSVDLVRPIAEAKGIGLRVEGASDGIELRTDARKFCQILVNLLGNAVKFTASGEVVLLLRVEAQGANGTLHCEVTDTGPGIKREDQAHVFDAFWQADRRSAQSLGGTGLGLPVARQLARVLGGEVRIARSEPGRGSTFVLSLPVTDAEVAVAR